MSESAAVGGGQQGHLLVLVRHAKAEPYADEDITRELTDRGRRDAAEVGRWLATQGYGPDLVLVSPAQRTVSTWAAMARGAGSDVTETIDQALYTAPPETVLEIVRTLPESRRVVAIVGHSPTIAFVAHLLGDDQPDPDAFRALSQGYPTSAATVLEAPAAWGELVEGTARIIDFHVGRG